MCVFRWIMEFSGVQTPIEFLFAKKIKRKFEDWWTFCFFEEKHEIILEQFDGNSKDCKEISRLQCKIRENFKNFFNLKEISKSFSLMEILKISRKNLNLVEIWNFQKN